MIRFKYHVRPAGVIPMGAYLEQLTITVALRARALPKTVGRPPRQPRRYDPRRSFIDMLGSKQERMEEIRRRVWQA